MGFLTHRVEREQINAGDHIYTWRAVFTYSHHGIYVGGSKVVHFTNEQHSSRNPPLSSSLTSSVSSSRFPASSSKHQPICPTFPDCGFRQPGSGVILSCLDCFLGNGSLYLFEYGVASSVFLTKLRGGTCTIAQSDPPEAVVHRAMFLLQNGFGNYDVFKNNCEDFAMYCKTGLLVVDSTGLGRSGQASSFIGAPLAAILSSPLKFLMTSPVGVATATAGMYCMSKYATDIGVRSDVVKVQVEDMALLHGWVEHSEELPEEDENQERQIVLYEKDISTSGQITTS
ncbi:protein LEAD-SENSITIVE 1-like [Malania oleifera]|uniref:protein LEAD-SENSITIVE 1-like n=1 Tax=Malania oleifera TaxID=397392 RepID=UPI0025AE6CF8|nr:protein LEAD-SENSITIVE 1-like [Malania oleifera]